MTSGSELSRRYLQAGRWSQRRGDLDRAAGYLRACLQSDARDADAHDALAGVEFTHGRVHRAIEHSRRAVDIRADSAPFRTHLASALLCGGFVDDAADQLRIALKFKPDSADARLNLGAIHLLHGEFAEGWAGYAHRPAVIHCGVRQARAWTGEPLNGAPILLRSEQGFGDTIQFCRYAPLVAARGGSVVLQTPGPLKSLLRSVPDVAEVVAGDDVATDVEWEALLGSLPGIFETRLESIPRTVPYLTADSRRRARFHAQMSPDCVNVGLVWSGNPRNPRDRLRSIGAREFEPLCAINGARFFSLQCGDPASEAATLPPHRIDELQRDTADFCDTAAAISALDLVISVDTAVAHLAGALAVPVWILIPIGPDWRWMLDTPHSPWYPTARLFRQTELGDWHRVVKTMASALRALVGKSGVSTSAGHVRP